MQDVRVASHQIRMEGAEGCPFGEMSLLLGSAPSLGVSSIVACLFLAENRQLLIHTR